MMNKVLIGLLGAGMIATGGYGAATGIDDSAPARTVSLPGATTADTTTADTATTADTRTVAATTDDIVVGNAPAPAVTTSTEDVSGPCDEGEHANDQRCTGDDGGDDDRSGSNEGSDDDSADSDEDRSGSNSGKG